MIILVSMLKLDISIVRQDPESLGINRSIEFLLNSQAIGENFEFRPDRKQKFLNFIVKKFAMSLL